MTEEEVRQLQDENASLKKKVEELREEMLRLISRNLDLSERLEYDVELRRRTEVAREIMAINLERQRNADLAETIGVSMGRLTQLFRHQTIHRTPDAYIDNLRVLAALRLLREKPNYTIAVVAEEAGFTNVRTLQRRIQEAIGMSPVEYRLMLTRDL